MNFITNTDLNYFTKQDIIDYMNVTSKESAYGLTLLMGPDGFENYEDYEEILKMLSN